ncbi:hypothetical protein F8154_02150 [Alkaliphilus pronyensis]|uniref:Uncharacterized protein n=1 Tax=Alkaliphilus pronyensis TaxID=1482732 RepID=A0A6I0FI96_9FIRM|nr:hypothetical protein [Alkaliphilus pronyensis]KAB3537803.1 hypothetical protein F8154_02150 [Alkaliphilus pronyensis]
MQRRYRRFFVILESEDTVFEKSNQGGLKGYSKVEISNDKGTMTLYCQNIKPALGKDMRYRWYLINAKGDKEPNIVDIGPMEIDSNGKGEVQWEFNAANVKASGESIDEFNLLVLLSETVGENKVLEAPLVGYIDKEKINWKPMVEEKLFGSFKKSDFKSKISEASSLQAKNPKENSVIGGEKESRNDKTKQSKNDSEKKLEKVDRSENKKYPSPKSQFSYSFEEDNIGTEKTPQTKEGRLTEGASSKKNQEDPFGEKSLLKSLQVYIESTLKMFPKVNPFEENLPGYQWWQIYYNYQTIYRSYMPFIAYIEGINHTPYFYPYQQPSEYHRQIYLYQHYIFGIAYDSDQNAKYYVYGIPGKRGREDQPYKGSTGFIYWHPCKTDTTKNPSGYWLLHIDVKTGKVITPLAKTEV